MSKTDIDKIIDLIESDDQNYQELGCVMAVSQGLKDEVLKKLHTSILLLIRVQLNFPAVDFECYKTLSYFNNNNSITHVEAFDSDNIEPRLIYFRTICEKAERYTKLKNYNHE